GIVMIPGGLGRSGEDSGQVPFLALGFVLGLGIFLGLGGFGFRLGGFGFRLGGFDFRLGGFSFRLGAGRLGTRLAAVGLDFGLGRFLPGLYQAKHRRGIDGLGASHDGSTHLIAKVR